ncbi:O-antigen ligase family protein [Clostridium sp.]|uniref:O-antigen ligase family protein n=1 Tax=Clostridium sp. TaxID=1506 RepID=UPI002605CEAD|nr:O-antigen ligase family protein [Clostridium sp.]
MKVKNKEKRTNRFELAILSIILILIENCFFLIDVNSVNIKGIFNYDDIPLALSIIWSFYVLIKYRDIKVEKYRLKYQILFVPVLVIISSIRGQQLYGQSMLLGIRPQRFFLLLFLMYFPFCKFLHADERNKVDLEKVLYKLGVIALIIYTTQYVLSSKILFLYVRESFRYGGTRLHFDSILVNIVFFFTLENILRKIQMKKNFVILSLLVFYNIFIIRGRLSILALLFSSILIILLCKKNLLIKIPGIIFGVLIFGGLLMTPLLSEYASVLNKDTRSLDPNYIIRELGKENYLKQLKNSPIVGRGYINELNEKAYEASGIDKGYYLNDNGITAFVYMYGIIGGVWAISLFIKMYVYAFEMYIKQKKQIYMAYIIYLTVLLPNILQFYWGFGPMYTIIIMCSLEANLDVETIVRIKNGEGNNSEFKMEGIYGV